MAPWSFHPGQQVKDVNPIDIHAARHVTRTFYVHFYHTLKSLVSRERPRVNSGVRLNDTSFS